MKRFFGLCVFFCIIFVSAVVYAQTAKVIGLKGEVFVKVSPSSDWQTAKKFMFLDKNSEVQTDAAAECILAFDEQLKNVITIKEKTLIKLESIKPGKVNLPQGRVFSLIDNISKVEKFEIVTPTAVAGARGTGWETEFKDNTTSVACFEDAIEVNGIDEQGNVTETMEVDSGLELDIGSEGRLGETTELSTERVQEWNEARNDMESARESAEKESAAPEPSSPTSTPSTSSPTQSSEVQTTTESKETAEAPRENIDEGLSADKGLGDMTDTEVSDNVDDGLSADGDLSEMRDTESSREESFTTDSRENTRELTAQEDRVTEEAASVNTETRASSSDSSETSSEQNRMNNTTQ